MRVYLTSLGCKLNQSEIEMLARHFARTGHQPVSQPELADLCVVNSCTVTHIAARKSRQLVRSQGPHHRHRLLRGDGPGEGRGDRRGEAGSGE